MAEPRGYAGWGIDTGIYINTAATIALVNTLCLGILLSQLSIYLHQFSEDRWYFKVYVVFVVTFAAGQTLEMVVHLYEDIKVWPYLKLDQVEVLINALINAVVQPFFMWRVWTVTRMKSVVFGMCLLYLCSKVTCIGAGIALLLDLPSAKYIEGIRITMMTALSLNFCLDVAITTPLIVHFRRSRIGASHLDKTLDKLIAVTWSSAAPPGIALIIGLCLMIKQSTVPVSTFFITLSGKLYCHALLKTLNCRTSLRKQVNRRSAPLGRISIHDWDLRQMGIIETTKAQPLQAKESVPGTVYTLNQSDDDGLSFKSNDNLPEDDPERLQTIVGALREGSPNQRQRHCSHCGLARVDSPGSDGGITFVHGIGDVWVPFSGFQLLPQVRPGFTREDSSYVKRASV